MKVRVKMLCALLFARLHLRSFHNGALEDVALTLVCTLTLEKTFCICRMIFR